MSSPREPRPDDEGCPPPAMPVKMASWQPIDAESGKGSNPIVGTCFQGNLASPVGKTFG